jgi:hypothetical protein
MTANSAPPSTAPSLVQAKVEVPSTTVASVSASGTGTNAIAMSGSIPGMAAPLTGSFTLRSMPGEPGPGIRNGGELLTALDNSLWIADGDRSDRQIYILSGPCCGYSQALYHATRQLRGVQLRWVEMAPTPKAKCLGYLGEIAATNGPGALADMYDTGAGPQVVPIALQDNAIRLNTNIQNAAYSILRELNPNHTGRIDYPTVVWLSKDGVRVATRPDNFDAIVASVVARPEATNTVSFGRSFLNTSYQYQPIPSKMYLAKSANAEVYSFPDARSQLVYTMPLGSGYRGSGRRVTVAGVSWVELAPQGVGGPSMYMRESDVYPTQ